MNGVDVVIIVVIAASTLYSLKQGFIKEVFGILAIVLGVVASLYLHAPIGQLLTRKGFGPQVGHILGFVLVFLAVSVGLSLLGRILRSFVRAALLGWLDRLLGALMGFLKGLVLVCVVLALLTTYTRVPGSLLGPSKLSRPMLKILELMTPIFPKEVGRMFKEQYQELRNWIEDHAPKPDISLPDIERPKI